MPSRRAVHPIHAGTPNYHEWITLVKTITNSTTWYLFLWLNKTEFIFFDNLSLRQVFKVNSYDNPTFKKLVFVKQYIKVLANYLGSQINFIRYRQGRHSSLCTRFTVYGGQINFARFCNSPRETKNSHLCEVLCNKSNLCKNPNSVGGPDLSFFEIKMSHDQNLKYCLTMTPNSMQAVYFILFSLESASICQFETFTWY